MRVRVHTNDRGTRLARDLVGIGIPATQAETFAKKFLRLAARPGKIYKKAKKATKAVKTSRRASLSATSPFTSRIVRIQGTASSQIAIKRAAGEYVIEPFGAQPKRKSANRRMQGKLSHK